MFDKPIPCIVELFGRQVIAGLVSEQTIGGAAFIRVDVPDVEGAKGFTKFFGGASIYAMTPTDEATMLRAVTSYRVQPIEVFRLALPARSTVHDPDGYDEDDDEPCEGWNGDGM